MPRPCTPVPKYRKTPRGTACIDVYTRDGRRTCINLPGPFGSDESVAAYHEQLALLRAY